MHSHLPIGLVPSPIIILFSWKYDFYQGLIQMVNEA
jgi:hypothetical protein